MKVHHSKKKPNLTKIIGFKILIVYLTIFQWNCNSSFDEEIIKEIIPFKEIGNSLGQAAKSNNYLTLRGMTILDANNDGRLDLYFCHSGRPTSKKDINGVLQPNIAQNAKPNVLYMNMGNEQDGSPIYRTVSQIISEKENNTYTKEELLIENKYKPRTAINDDPFEVGRIAWGACSADFNGDGLVDILVLNHHYGQPYQPPFGYKFYPPGKNLSDNEDKQDVIEVSIPSFYHGKKEDGKDITVNFNGEEEFEGRNSLFINKGDKDNDGLIEWEDMTKATGMDKTNWSSCSATVSDFDQDGDLDIYISNFVDPDFWGFGGTSFSGNPNELWVNQLSEKGTFQFIEMAESFNVSTSHNDPNSNLIWSPYEKKAINPNEMVFNGKKIGTASDHSWASIFTDIDNDGWDDLIVANDLGNNLRIFKNLEGKKFERLTQYDDYQWHGAWMGINVGDLDGDLSEEIAIGNMGTKPFAKNNPIFRSSQLVYPLFVSIYPAAIQKKSSVNNIILSKTEDGLKNMTNKTNIKHNLFFPPEISYKENRLEKFSKELNDINFKTSLFSLEFSWNPSIFDIENDGDLDLYFVGSLNRGNDNFAGDATPNPGRLLINEGAFSFSEKAYQYRLLNIMGIEYNASPPRRKSPSINWEKGDYVYLEDKSSIQGQGLDNSKNSITHDIFKLHEAACGNVVADLNNDGFQDIIVYNSGGNNSLSPDAINLMVENNGKEAALPPPSRLQPALTNFEEGSVMVFINQEGTKDIQDKKWIKIKLQNKNSFNIHGIGAKIIINNKIMRRIHIGGESFSSVHAPLLIGLGNEDVHKIEIFWNAQDKNSQIIIFETPISNQTIKIRKEE